MRLLVVGKLNGQLSVAVKMAMNAGAKVSHVETTEQATNALRAGQGADLMMVDYGLDIAGLPLHAYRGSGSEREQIGLPDWIINLQRPFPKPEWLMVSSGVLVMLVLPIVTSLETVAADGVA